MLWSKFIWSIRGVPALNFRTLTERNSEVQEPFVIADCSLSCNDALRWNRINLIEHVYARPK